MYRFILYLFYILTFSLKLYALDMYAFNSGQGNFFLLKKGSNVLAVDCGGSDIFGKLHHTYQRRYQATGDIGRFIKTEILQNATSCDLVFTHNHSDHRNIVLYLRDIVDSINVNRGRQLNVREINATDFGTVSGTISFLQDPEITFFHWFPEYSGQESQLYDDEHDYNLVLKLCYRNRNILFTGDASARLFTHLRQEYSKRQDLYRSLLGNISCLIMPHHGSNRSGEYAWFYAVKDLSTIPDYPLLTLISSDPNPEKGRDALPWYGVTELPCKRGTPAAVIAGHRISFGGGYEYTIKKPIFTTCDSGAFYKMTIACDGNIILVSDVDTLTHLFRLL